MKIIMQDYDESNTVVNTELRTTGNIIPIPYKFNRQIQKTLKGKSKESFIDVFTKKNVTFDYLTEENYNKLLLIWKSTDTTYLIEENGMKSKVIITNEQLDFSPLYNSELDETYYTGSIELDETY